MADTEDRAWELCKRLDVVLAEYSVKHAEEPDKRALRAGMLHALATAVVAVIDKAHSEEEREALCDLAQRAVDSGLDWERIPPSSDRDARARRLLFKVIKPPGPPEDGGEGR